MKETPANNKSSFERWLNGWLDTRLARLSSARKQKAAEFVDEMRIAKFSPQTIKASVQAILTLGYDGKAYEDLTQDDLKEWMRQLDANGRREETIRSYRRRAKHFLRWVHGARTARDPTPELLQCIRVSERRSELQENVLSPEEIQRLLTACEGIKNRALVHVGYESGCRAGELLGMKIKDLEFDNFGAVAIVRGKTGARRLRLVESIHDLQLWLNAHKDRANPDAWLWPNKNGGPITSERFNDILKLAARKIGLHKRIYPHLLRHSRATELAQVLTRYQLCVQFGWTMSSDMPERYIHRAGVGIDDAILHHYGISTDNGARTCPRCATKNANGAIYCARCSMVLSTKEAIALEDRKTKEEEILAKVVKKLIELAPDLLERALRESGVVQEIKQLKAVQAKAGGIG